MGKFSPAGGGGAKEGGGKGRGGLAGGVEKKKGKSYKGLAVLDRGTSGYRSDKKDVAKLKGYQEAKRKAAYAKMLERDGYTPLEFPDEGVEGAAAEPELGGKNKNKKRGKKGALLEAGAMAARMEEGSGTDEDGSFADMSDLQDSDECDFSDEEVDDGAIVFKEEKAQIAWTGEVGGKRKAAGGKGALARKGEGVTVPGGMFDVPDWGDGAGGKKGGGQGGRDDEWEVVEKGKGKGKKAGKKSKPNPFGRVAGEAESRRREEEERREKEREEAEKAREGRDAYFKGRKKERAMHLKKTKKGQPVLKNMIDGMLAKLQKQTL